MAGKLIDIDRLGYFLDNLIPLLNKKQDKLKQGSNIEITNDVISAIVPSDLSDLNDDETHRLVSDSEKAEWNSKAKIIKLTQAEYDAHPEYDNDGNLYIITDSDDSIAASDVDFVNTNTNLQADNVQSAIEELEQNFQDGVDSVYDAVVAKGSTPDSKSLGDVIKGIENISGGGGIDVSDTTATSEHVLEGKYFYDASGKRTEGGIYDKSNDIVDVDRMNEYDNTLVLKCNEYSYISPNTILKSDIPIVPTIAAPVGYEHPRFDIPKGYHDGTGYVEISGETLYITPNSEEQSFYPSDEWSVITQVFVHGSSSLSNVSAGTFTGYTNNNGGWDVDCGFVPTKIICFTNTINETQTTNGFFTADMYWTKDDGTILRRHTTSNVASTSQSTTTSASVDNQNTWITLTENGFHHIADANRNARPVFYIAIG